MFRFAFLLVTLLSFSACKTSQRTRSEWEIMRITHGTSFGHCRGYCIKEMTLTAEKLNFSELSRDTTNFPKKTTSQTFSKKQLDKLIAEISPEKWNALSERIGCPDCADGGAEYIELVTNKGTKRVTFEYGSDVPEIRTFLAQLRTLRQTVEK